MESGQVGWRRKLKVWRWREGGQGLTSLKSSGSSSSLLVFQVKWRILGMLALSSFFFSKSTSVKSPSLSPPRTSIESWEFS